MIKYTIYRHNGINISIIHRRISVFPSFFRYDINIFDNILDFTTSLLTKFNLIFGMNILVEWIDSKSVDNLRICQAFIVGGFSYCYYCVLQTFAKRYLKRK